MDDFDFDVEETSTSEAKEVEQTTGSKYGPLADRWKQARENENAVILRGVSKNQVDNIRTYMYRAFNKKNVIVRSKAQSDGDEYNVTIRPREDGEYLQAKDTSEDNSTEEMSPAVTADVAEDTSEETETNGTMETTESAENGTMESGDEDSIVDEAASEEVTEEDEEMEMADDFF